MSDFLKMVSSMDKESKIMEMVINTKVSILMDYQTVMVNIYGLMDLFIQEILSRVVEMVMENGKLKMDKKNIVDIIF